MYLMTDSGKETTQRQIGEECIFMRCVQVGTYQTKAMFTCTLFTQDGIIPPLV